MLPKEKLKGRGKELLKCYERAERNIEALALAITALTLNEKLVEKMEELYGGARNLPSCTEENEEAVLKIWDTAIERCIAIAQNVQEM